VLLRSENKTTSASAVSTAFFGRLLRIDKISLSLDRTQENMFAMN